MTEISDILNITAAIYKSNEVAKRLYKDEYPAKIEWYNILIKAVMEKKKINALEAVIFITKEPEIQGNPMTVMLLLAAALDLIKK